MLAENQTSLFTVSMSGTVPNKTVHNFKINPSSKPKSKTIAMVVPQKAERVKQVAKMY